MEWEARLAELWAALDEQSEGEFLAAMQQLTDELPDGSAIALFERACALDSTGHSDRAVPLYREALDIGLEGIRRRRAVIQMASSLRNLGQSDTSVRLLGAEQRRSSDELDDAVSAFLALALADIGREREALSLALQSLAPHLPRYQRSCSNYARALIQSDRGDER
jgi:tetratricopeptide (TPR) repeat protein